MKIRIMSFSIFCKYCIGLAMLLSAMPFIPGVSLAESTRVTIAVGGKATLYYLPLTVAERKGFFKEEGLDISILDFPGGSKALQAMIGGSADVVSGGFDHTIMMQARGQFLTAFVVQGRTPAISLVVVKKREPEWSDPSVLKGWKIGVTAPGSSTNMFVNALLASVNLNTNQVSIIGVGTGQSAIAAISAGHIDALANIEPVVSILERDGLAREVVETMTAAGSQKVYGAAIPSASLYATTKWIERNPETVTRLTRAIVKSLRWISASTNKEIMAVLPEKNLMGDPKLFSMALDRQRLSFSLDGRFEPGVAEAALRALARFNNLSQSSIDIKKTYTNKFVDIVQKKSK